MTFDSPTSSQSSSIYENFSSTTNNGGGSQRTTNLLKNDTNSLPATSSYNDAQQKQNTSNQNNNLINLNGNTSSGGGGGLGFNLINDNDKFSAIFENTTNENYENTQKDSTPPSSNGIGYSHQLLESERTNGNYEPPTTTKAGTTSNGTSQKRMFPKDWNDMIEDERRGVS